MAIITPGQPRQIPQSTYPTSPQPIEADVSSGDLAMGSAIQRMSQTLAAVGFALKQQMDQNDLANAMTVYQQRMADLQRDLVANPRQIGESQLRIAGAQGVEGAAAEAAELAGEYRLYNNRAAQIEARDQITSDISESLLRSGYSRRRFQQWVNQQRIVEDDEMTKFDITQNRSMLFDQLKERLSAIQERGGDAPLSGDLQTRQARATADAYEQIRIARDEMGIINQETADELADKIGNNIAIRQRRLDYREMAREDEEAAWDALSNDELEWTTHDGETRNLSLADREALQEMIRSEGQYWREVDIRKRNDDLFVLHDETQQLFNRMTNGEISQDAFMDIVLNDPRGDPFNGQKFDYAEYWRKQLDMYNRGLMDDVADGVFTPPADLRSLMESLHNNISLDSDAYNRAINQVQVDPRWADKDIPYEYWNHWRNEPREVHSNISQAFDFIDRHYNSLISNAKNAQEAAAYQVMKNQARDELWRNLYADTGEGTYQADLRSNAVSEARIKEAMGIASSIVHHRDTEIVAEMIEKGLNNPQDYYSPFQRDPQPVLTSGFETYLGLVHAGFGYSLWDEDPGLLSSLKKNIENTIERVTNNSEFRSVAYRNSEIDIIFSDVTAPPELQQYVRDGDVRMQFRLVNPDRPSRGYSLYVRNIGEGWTDIRNIPGYQRFSFWNEAPEIEFGNRPPEYPRDDGGTIMPTEPTPRNPDPFGLDLIPNPGPFEVPEPELTPEEKLEQDRRLRRMMQGSQGL